MIKIFRIQLVLAFVVFLASSVCFAQTNPALASPMIQDSYKQYCQSCHGANGVPTAATVKLYRTIQTSAQLQKRGSTNMPGHVISGYGLMKPIKLRTVEATQDVLFLLHMAPPQPQPPAYNN